MGGAVLERTTPVEIRKKGGTALTIAWKDGHLSRYEPVALREQCPCAHCVDELTGRRRFGAGQASPGLELRGTELVGHYALQISFSDGHATGIYPFELLRALCPCGVCGAAGSGSAA